MGLVCAIDIRTVMENHMQNIMTEGLKCAHPCWHVRKQCRRPTTLTDLDAVIFTRELLVDQMCLIVTPHLPIQRIGTSTGQQLGPRPCA